MDLVTTIGYINSLPLTQDAKDNMIYQLEAADMEVRRQAQVAKAAAEAHAAAHPPTLRETQLDMAAHGTVGKGNPPPILPPKSFNPVLSQAGIAQIWYTDEPNGGWPAAIANQDHPGPTDVYFATNPTGGGYWTTKAAVDAMPPPIVPTDWAAVNERMKHQNDPPAPVVEPPVGNPPVVEG